MFKFVGRQVVDQLDDDVLQSSDGERIHHMQYTGASPLRPDRQLARLGHEPVPSADQRVFWVSTRTLLIAGPASLRN